MSKRISVVVGGAGFIGSNLCQTLLENGDRVICVDDLSNSIEFLSDEALSKEFIHGDINSSLTRQKVIGQIGKVDNSQLIIWHLAANSDIQKSSLQPEIDIEKTLKSTISSIELARSFVNPFFIFASSSAVYGQSSIKLKEEDVKLEPISPYGISKLASEYFLKKSLGYELKKLFIFRFPNVLGTPSTHGVLHDWRIKLQSSPTKLEVLGNGSQQKQYLNVKTLIDMMLFVIDKAESDLNVYNLSSSDEGISIKQLADLFLEMSQTNFQIEYGTDPYGWRGDVSSYILDTTKLRHLGWQKNSNSFYEASKSIKSMLNNS